MNCPHCESENVIKSGKLRNKFSIKQGHRCKNCGRYFIERDGFEGLTYPKEIVITVLFLFGEGLSLSMIRGFIYHQYGYWIYDGSILNWIRKYPNVVREFKSKQMPKPGISSGKLFVEWQSLSKIKDFVHQQYGYRVKNGSILNLASKYGAALEDFRVNESESWPRPSIKLVRGNRALESIQAAKSEPTPLHPGTGSSTQR